MSFTDQKQRVATTKDCQSEWNGGKGGERFRCFLCGHKFKVGDKWRWVAMTGYINFLTCDSCDGEGVRDRWAERCKKYASMLKNEFWALVD